MLALLPISLLCPNLVGRGSSSSVEVVHILFVSPWARDWVSEFGETLVLEGVAWGGVVFFMVVHSWTGGVELVVAGLITLSSANADRGSSLVWDFVASRGTQRKL
jgi:hypothetical protein